MRVREVYHILCIFSEEFIKNTGDCTFLFGRYEAQFEVFAFLVSFPKQVDYKPYFQEC